MLVVVRVRTKRANWFWVADRELAEAWVRLHAVQGQKMK